ncbi:imidazole glycerol phosphate synthase subunit HisH [Yunchengibacter salinarum]|uniref:imidazole glycerol phosphate synthase subunit HisH n=1 Tax=Yunchengibacter salinarum TaxID=3133399 RepID=UPI0035B5A06B
MAETVIIVDYGSGNLRSAEKAVARAADEAGLNLSVRVTSDADRVARADRVILPGVGAFGDCRAGLDALDGMVGALSHAALTRARPFLGICVGMQLMAKTGHEHGDHAGLGWLKAHTTALKPDDPSLKIPHMGWNTLSLTPAGRAHPVTGAIAADAHAYFVHSYHMVPDEPGLVLAETDYGGPVTAIVGRDTLIGTQFHPEKSQSVGLDLITRFLEWRP